MDHSINFKILHLSDLHFGNTQDANRWYSQLADDLKHELDCQQLDAMIISGDTANYANVEEYNAAAVFIKRLCSEFGLESANLVIVPGNHDLNWKLSEAAYARVEKKHTESLQEGSYIDESDAVVQIRDDSVYKKRFSPFSNFYHDIKEEPYPLEHKQQGIIHYLKEMNLLILGLNSAWQVDHHFKSRAGICPDALSTVLDTIRQNSVYAECLKFAVWHHPLNSPCEDRITDHGFMERLAQSGFSVCFHGHLHKATSDLFRYDHSASGRRIEIVGAGTFGAPIKEWYPGYPLQYNLLKISHRQIIVETRCRTEINGAWKPHAIWYQGPRQDPLPRYKIDLVKPELRSSAIIPAQILISNAKTRWNFPDDASLLRLECRGSDGDQLHSAPDSISQDDLIAKVLDGINLFLIGEAGVGKTTTLIALCEKMLQNQDSPLPVFIDAASWISTGKTLLEYIESFPAFKSTDIDIKKLSILNEMGSLLIILNGWNEISGGKKDNARLRLQQFLGGARVARLIVSTRSANDLLEIPAPLVVTVRGFSWKEQETFIRKSLPTESARDFLTKLRGNPKLRSVARNPMILRGAVKLYSQKQIVTDVLFDLFYGIVNDYEATGSRSIELDGYPIRGCHREYLKALAEEMNSAAMVSISEIESRRIMSETAKNLVSKGRISQIPETEDIIAALCDYHLLHRSGTSELQFAHQRFQEFFSACALIERFDQAHSNAEEQKVLKTKILNAPFWEDAIELVAQKIASDHSRKSQAMLLIDLSLSVDLYYASQLAGILGFENEGHSSWQELQENIMSMYRHPATEAKEYALNCAVATRSPVFADILWPMLESDNDQERLQGYRLSGGLIVQQLGVDTFQRIVRWPEKRRVEAVWEFSERPENFQFVKHLIQHDPDTNVIAAAIAVLDYAYLSSDLALDAWWKAPIEVKVMKPAISLVLELWQPENIQLTQELIRVANRSDKEIKIKIGLHLLEHAGKIGIEAARQTLKNRYKERIVDDSLIEFLRANDPVFLKEFSVEQIKHSWSADEWILQEVSSLPAKDREKLVIYALDQLAMPENRNIDVAVASGATESLTERLLDEGLNLVLTDWTDRRAADANRNRFRAIERLLSHVPSSFFIQGILSRAASCNYDQAAWIAEILDKRAKDDDFDQGEVRKKTLWRPDIHDLDSIIEAFRSKSDTRVISSCRLEANLVSLASKTDPERYLDFVLWGVQRHARAYKKYEEGLAHWLKERERSPRPSNPPYEQWFVRALRRCAFDAVPRLLKIAKEYDASHIVSNGLVFIVSGPWFQQNKKEFPFFNRYVRDHQNRISLGRVFKQPNDVNQSATDEVATFLTRKIDGIISDGGTLYDSDLTKQSPEIYSFWELCKMLSRVPSQVCIPTLNAVLVREDHRLYPYLDIAQNVISQGGNLPIEALKAIKNIWLRETGKKWLDDSTRNSLSMLAVLHFFIESPEAGLAQLKELLPEWIKRAYLWPVVDVVEKIDTKESLTILTDLLPKCDSKSNYAERIIRSIASNPVPESAYVLLELLETGELSKYSNQMFGLGDSVAKRFQESAAIDARFKERLFAVLEAMDDSSEALVCNSLPLSDDTRAIMLIFRYFDEQTYPNGGQFASNILLKQFSRQIPSDVGSGYYEVHPQANIYLRSQLFTLASKEGPSQNRARAILVTLEEMRIESGRPAEEARHPAIETDKPWPTFLYV